MVQFLVQRKKKDAEERRARQKKAQEDFRNMLEVSWLLLLDVFGSLGLLYFSLMKTNSFPHYVLLSGLLHRSPKI